MSSYRLLGAVIIAVSLLFFLVGYSYIRTAENALLTGHEIGTQGECLHPEGAVCPYAKLNQLAVPKYVGLFVDLLFFSFGLFLFFKKTPEEKGATKTKRTAQKLSGEEKKLFELIVQSNGMMYQHELVEKLTLSKVQVTRLLDRLESKGIVERRRRGMTNVVILK